VSLAKNLTRARERAGLTQAQLAKALKKSRSSINEYETGEHKPKLAVLLKIAKLTKTPIEELVA